MRCRQCGSPDTRVVETRRECEAFVIKRRRRCVDCGLSFHSFEVDDSLERTLMTIATRRGRVDALMTAIRRWHRDQRIVRMAAAGEKHAVIAQMTGLSDHMVTTIVSRWKKGLK